MDSFRKDRLKIPSGLSPQARQWLEENREAIEENNRYFAKYGLPFGELRHFRADYDADKNT